MQQLQQDFQCFMYTYIVVHVFVFLYLHTYTTWTGSFKCKRIHLRNISNADLLFSRYTYCFNYVFINVVAYISLLIYIYIYTFYLYVYSIYIYIYIYVVLSSQIEAEPCSSASTSRCFFHMKPGSEIHQNQFLGKTLEMNHAFLLEVLDVFFCLIWRQRFLCMSVYI